MINRVKFFQPLKTISAESGRIPLPEADARKQGFTEGRSDYDELRAGVIEKMGQSYEEVLKEISQRLPGLVTTAVERLLGGVTLEAEHIANIVEEVLNTSAPENENLEVCLCEEDYKKLVESQNAVVSKYTKVTFKTDPSLSAGDCIVSSRFGLVDARVETKLEQVKDELS